MLPVITREAWADRATLASTQRQYRLNDSRARRQSIKTRKRLTRIAETIKESESSDSESQSDSAHSDKQTKVIDLGKLAFDAKPSYQPPKGRAASSRNREREPRNPLTLGYYGRRTTVSNIVRTETGHFVHRPAEAGREWRTPPLWGIRDTAPYTHDGRAATLLQAIAMHEGEAAPTRDRFLSLSLDDQKAIIAFLNTMVAPKNAEPF